ncbi:MAG: hypothetical protein AB2387_00690 [Stutzerimonas stutzeri]
MNADIQKAVFDLFCLCVDITQAGRFEVHMDYAGNTNGLYVRAYNAKTGEQLLNRRTYLDGLPGESEADVLEHLRSITASVAGLQAEQIKQEAA